MRAAAADDPRPSTAACASLVFIERGALLFAALAYVHRPPLVAAAVGAATLLLFILRTSAFGLRSRRVETLALARLLRVALRSRSLEVNDANLRAGVLRGVQAIGVVDGRLRPGFYGELAAAVLFVPYFALQLGLAANAALLGAGLVAAAVAYGSRRVARRLSFDAADSEEAAVRAVLEGALGREELGAAGVSLRYEERASALSRVWERAQVRASVAATLLGRAPLAVAVAVGAGVYFALRGRLDSAELMPAVVLLPPLGGAFSAIAEWIRMEGIAAPTRRLLRAPLERTTTKELGGQLVPLQAVAVGVSFGEVSALREVELRFGGPSLVVLAGPNGSGKSTLLKALVALVPLSTGAISYGGLPLAEIEFGALRRRISYLSQHPHLPAMATVFEAMTFLDEAPRADILAALERVEVLPALRTHDPTDPLAVSVDDLSGGERQRIALARALLRKDAELFLFDEPDANLDRRGIDRVVGILEELSTRAVVIVAAHTEEVIAAADVVVHLDAGRVVTPPAPADNPRSPAASTKAAS